MIFNRKELQYVRQKSAILSTFETFLHTSSIVACFISLTVLIITGVELSTYSIFMVLALIRTIRLSASSKFAAGVNFIGAVTGSLGRIQTFLELEESVYSEDMYSRKRTRSKIRSFLDLTDAEMSKYLSAEDVTKISNDIRSGKSVPQYEPVLIKQRSLDAPDNPSNDIHVTFENVSCHWGGGNKSVVLRNITFRAASKELTLINGPAGCGKSSLLAAILGELPPTEGYISCVGKIAYVPQIPWIFSNTLRENILFGKPYNPFRYQAIVNACNLQKDIDKLSDGDLTFVGNNGLSLTEDQKARMGIARAAYSDADIYLLDDPFAPVDARVAEQVFGKCVCGLLSKRIRILASRQLQYVERADQILTMRAGTIVNEVTSQVMGYRSVKLHSPGESRERERKCPSNKTVEFAIEEEIQEKYRTRSNLFEEEEMMGPVSCTILWNYLRTGACLPFIVVFALFTFVVQGKKYKRNKVLPQIQR